MPSDNNFHCRVCGYLPEMPPWGGDGQSPTYEICPCCGVEYGYEDSTVSSVKKYRDEWADAGYKWQDVNAKPKFWNLEDQLKRIPEIFL